MKNQNNGFTLVELSIVLVIIGLLIGGILAAQSMISTAKVMKYVGTISQYEVAFTNFKTKFNSLPGDSTLLSPQGNGDGLIGAADASDSSIAVGAERIAVFNHLVQSGYYPEQVAKTYTAVAGTIKLGENLPKIGDNAGVIIYSNLIFNGAPVMYVGNLEGATVGSVYDAARHFMDGQEYIAIDTKIDNGIAETGNSRGYNNPCSGFICVLAPTKCYIGGKCNFFVKLNVN